MDNKDVIIVGLVILLIIICSTIIFVVLPQNNVDSKELINNTSSENMDMSNQSINEVEEVSIPKAEQPSAYGNVAVTFEEANSNLAHTPDYAAREMFNSCDENGDGILSGQEYDDWRYMVKNSQYAHKH
ncbi:MAG: hypothetical protein KO202_07580 [Methanobacteriaceae archaeon]|jgi:hypothetical protein|nr:hypothetical protein [Methanobacteriaceae archaeon]